MRVIMASLASIGVDRPVRYLGTAIEAQQDVKTSTVSSVRETAFSHEIEGHGVCAMMSMAHSQPVEVFLWTPCGPRSHKFCLSPQLHRADARGVDHLLGRLWIGAAPPIGVAHFSLVLSVPIGQWNLEGGSLELSSNENPNQLSSCMFSSPHV